MDGEGCFHIIVWAVLYIKLLKKIPVVMLGNLLSFLSMANSISLQQDFRSFILREGTLYF